MAGGLSLYTFRGRRPGLLRAPAHDGAEGTARPPASSTYGRIEGMAELTADTIAVLAETARILGTTLTVLPPHGSDAAPVVIDGREAAEG